MTDDALGDETPGAAHSDATPQRPDVAALTQDLKDFQRATVHHAFDRLWTAADGTRRFLVADEVGLGKTMVAKGVIAKTIDHLWESIERIDIVYICSNAQIAAQNLNHLRKVSGDAFAFADRLTMLPTVIRTLGSQKVNFVSFTPGTSFNLKSRGGRWEERVLLHRLLAKLWGHDRLRPERWLRFFEGQMGMGSGWQGGRRRFKERVAAFDVADIDDTIVQAFGERIDSQRGPGGGRLVDELVACVDDFNYLRRPPDEALSQRRYALIGTLRTQLAHASVTALEPDLVILDEFQRFKDLLATDPEEETEASELARAIFDHPDARTLLLSATPYKMYTLPDDAQGDDHYDDFARTVRFMAGSEQAREIMHSLRLLRETVISGGDPDIARSAKDAAEQGLRGVMCRTERLAATPDRDGMLRECELPDVRLTADDVRAWRSFDAIASVIDRHDVFEYWRSAPYPLNIMDRGHYRVSQHFIDAIDDQNPDVRNQVAKGHGFLSWEDISAYREVDAGNAKIRGLMADVLYRGVWRLAWIPPTLPYYRLSGPYSDPGLCRFTKRLVFSAWDVVPKAISVMLSYEAERRTVARFGGAVRAYDERKVSRPLEYRMDGERPAAMSLFALMYPSVILARLGDPLAVARELGTLPAESDAVLGVVRNRIAEELAALRGEDPEGRRVDPAWYWAAPILLDRLHRVPGQDEFEKEFGAHDGSDDGGIGLGAHLGSFLDVDVMALGRMPDDLAEVLAHIALASPAIASLRALSRVCGGTGSQTRPMMRAAAFRIATAFRLMFNKPDLVTLLRGEDEGDTFWQAALMHCWEGCLQAVLDEYFHGLVESRSLQDRSGEARADEIADVCSEALGLRTVTNTVEDVRVDPDGVMRSHPRHIRLNIAARFGRATDVDGSEQRETSIRVAFNSPFRPFVLASTSVGQEGLDFHTYSHAVVHWNLPSNPVDLEQREGRVHRYKGHAVRKNVARGHADAALHATVDDPWYAMFLAAAEQRRDGETELTPYWVYPDPDGAAIERYVPAMPLSKEVQKRERLLRTVGAYRMVIGQPRQEDLLRYLMDRGIDASLITVDLRPPRLASSPRR